jgi:Zn-dependent M32 family carboxypeptidase
MDLQFEEAPCKIDDVIKMNYSFDNLHKFLNFLVLNDKDNFQNLKNMKIKLMEMDDIKENLNENNSKILNFDNKFNQIDGTINSFFQKFSEMDIKITSNDNVYIFKSFLLYLNIFTRKLDFFMMNYALFN